MSTRALTEVLPVRVTEQVRAELERIAARDERSVAAVVRQFIRQGLERESSQQQEV